MEVLKGLRNLNLTEGKYHDSKALIACNSSKVVHLVKSFYVTSVIKNNFVYEVIRTNIKITSYT